MCFDCLFWFVRCLLCLRMVLPKQTIFTHSLILAVVAVGYGVEIFGGVCVFFLSKKETSENNVEVKRFYVVLGFWCFGVLVFNIGC